MGGIGLFLTNLANYLAKRESNYSIRLLKELYDEETKLLEKILELETSSDSNPNEALILQLYSRTKRTRKLINKLQNSEKI